MFDKLLEGTGLKYEDLSPDEKEYLSNLVQSVSQNALTVEDIKKTIQAMKRVVEDELINEPEFNYIFIFKVPNRKQILLKARLRNYMLLEDVLTQPDRAKQALERALSNLRKSS